MDPVDEEALKHSCTNKNWTAEEKYSLVIQVISGKSIRSVAAHNGINPGMLYSWLRKYQNLGFRCITHNAAVGGVSNSQHLKGNAADIYTDICFILLLQTCILNTKG